MYTSTHDVEEAAQRERFALVGQMAGTILHDVKNGLTVIRAAAEMAEMQAPEIGQYADMIFGKVDSTVTMLQELLSFSRGETEAASEPTTVAVPDFLHQVAAGQMPALARADIELTLIADCEQAEFDPKQIERVLANLIANACDAMPGGGHLILRAGTEGGWLVLQVADSGCGMSPEVAARMFDPFFTHGKRFGTGLGGMVIRSLVQAHRGQLDVFTREGEGTVVSVFLPQPAAPAPSATTLLRDVERAAAAGLAEPNPGIRLAAVETLRRLGTDRAVAELCVALEDDCADVRYAAVVAVGEGGGAHLAELLYGALDDPVIVVRFAAAQALARFGDELGARSLRGGAVWSRGDAVAPADSARHLLV